MSNEALTWAWSRRGLKATEKLVLIRLADYADEQGSCFPSQKRVAEDCGMDRMTVNRALQRLADAALVSSEKRRRGGRQTSSRYYLALQSDGKSLYADDTQGDSVSSQSDGESLGQRDGESHQNPHTEPSLEPSEVLLASKPSQALMWDAVRAACGWPDRDLLSPAKARLGKTARTLLAGGATLDDVDRFARDYHAAWPGMSLTPEAMVKHWDLWRGGGLTPQARSRPVTAADRVVAAARASQEEANQNGHGYGSGGGGALGGGVPTLPGGRDHDLPVGDVDG